MQPEPWGEAGSSPLWGEVKSLQLLDESEAITRMDVRRGETAPLILWSRLMEKAADVYGEPPGPNIWVLKVMTGECCWFRLQVSAVPSCFPPVSSTVLTWVELFLRPLSDLCSLSCWNGLPAAFSCFWSFVFNIVGLWFGNFLAQVVWASSAAVPFLRLEPNIWTLDDYLDDSQVLRVEK